MKRIRALIILAGLLVLMLFAIWVIFTIGWIVILYILGPILIPLWLVYQYVFKPVRWLIRRIRGNANGKT